LTTLIILVMAVVSGCISPNIIIPGLNYATPHYWALNGILNVIVRGTGVEGVLMPSAVLLVMAAVFFFIGLKRFKFQ
jgi:ABC-2 type transport system permease protein